MFVQRDFQRQLSHETDFGARRAMIGRRAERRMSLFGESIEAIDDKIEQSTGDSMLARAVLSRNLGLLERVVRKGINLNMRYGFRNLECNGLHLGMTVLHYAAICKNVNIMNSSPVCPSALGPATVMRLFNIPSARYAYGRSLELEGVAQR